MLQKSWNNTWQNISWERDTPVQVEQKVNELIENGVDVNAIDLLEKTPLMYAAAKGYTNVVVKLIENGADLEKKDFSGETALMYASFYNKAETVEQLINSGADLENRDNEDKTALLYAVSTRSIQSTKKLLELGADVNSADFLKETPLLYAVGHNLPAMAEILIEAGADLDAKNIENNTALELAYTEETRRIVQAGIRNNRREKRIARRNYLLAEKENAPKTDPGRKAIRAKIEARRKEILAFQGKIKIREDKIKNLTASLIQTTPQRHALAERLQELRKEYGIHARKVAKDDALVKFFKEKTLTRE